MIKEKVEMINNRQSPIHDEYIEKYLKDKNLRLHATLDAEMAYRDADYVVIAAPTNYDPEKNYFDTHHIEDVIDIVQRVNPKAVMVIKSTIPVGYTRQLYVRYAKKGADAAFMRDKAEEFARLLKEGAIKEDVDVLLMGMKEAEAVKLFANTYLALRVSYFNELDTYAEMKGLETQAIINGVCLDPRIGGHYNNPSFGNGGVLSAKGY